MTTKIIRLGLFLALASASFIVFAGCSNQGVPVNLDEEIQMRDARITELEEQALQNQTQLEMTRREAEEATRRASDAETMALNTPVVPANMEGELLPPNAKAGQCYARVLVAPVYETTSERLMVKEASETIAIVPAKYEWAEEQILVKEASEKLIVTPATFRTVSEEMLVKPEGTRIVEVPAVYETETEKVLVSPAREYWKKGRGPIEKMDGSTGEIMCLVREEAVYKTVSKKVLKTKATTREEIIPAEYKTVSRKVIDQAAITRTEIIPAEYGTVKIKRLVSPAKEIRNPVEAEFRTVSKNVMTDPSYLEWRQILCETNMNQATISDVQTALKNKGFNPGPIDGIYGTQTRAAVKSFQQSKNLATGSLTYETVEALGMKF